MHCTRNGCDHERGEHNAPHNARIQTSDVSRETVVTVGGPCNVKGCLCYGFTSAEYVPEAVPSAAVVSRNLSLVGFCGECGGVGASFPPALRHYSDYPCRCA